MAVLAVWGWVPGVLSFFLFVVSLFLILLVLIQKGKGGGLAGAFGGAGGSSAFGSRAGDAFTRITIYVAAVWLLLIMLLIKVVQPAPRADTGEQVAPPAGAPAGPADQNEG
jgi:preprotein translocase subunit SecG